MTLIQFTLSIYLELEMITAQEPKVDTNYGCSGENYDNHSQTIYPNVTLSTSKIFSINIASALTAISANDQIGIRVRFHTVGANDTGLIGAKFVYNRS